MKEMNNNTTANKELMERIVNKWWHKFCYGFFTGEQLEMFYSDIEYANLELNEVIMEMLYKKKETRAERFGKLNAK